MFANNLKILRNDKKLSQEDLASFLGYSRSTISAYEMGRNEPSFEDLIKIAKIFDVSVDFLLTKSEKTAPKEQPLTDEQKKLASLVQGLTVSEMEKVNDYIDFVKSKRNQ